MTSMVMPLCMALAFVLCLLGGCGSPPQIPHRSHSEAEVKEFAKDMLGRSKLPRDQYEQYKKALSAP